VSTAVALFGCYPKLPAAIREQGLQAGFDGGHCIYLQPAGAARTPPFLDEFRDRVSVVADCVPASCVRGVNFMTHGGKAPCTPAEREALQTAMGTQDVAADETKAVAGIRKRYGLVLPAGRSWSAVVSAIGSESAKVIVGDPLGTADIPGVVLRDLKPYADGLANRFVLFAEPPPPPHPASEALPMWTQQATPANEIVTLPRGTAVLVGPGGPVSFTVGATSAIHAVMQVSGFWGYVLDRGGIRWVAKGSLAHHPA
jgi:hypothetical protein